MRLWLTATVPWKISSSPLEIVSDSVYLIQGWVWGMRNRMFIFRLFVVNIFISHASAYAESIIILGEIIAPECQSPLWFSRPRNALWHEPTPADIVANKLVLARQHAPGKCLGVDPESRDNFKIWWRFWFRLSCKFSISDYHLFLKWGQFNHCKQAMSILLLNLGE